MTKTTVCFCADRPTPKDYIGGGAGVMKLLERYLDPSELTCDVIYLYNNHSNRMGFFRDLIRLSKQKNVYFICHEPNSAAALSMLHKPYRMIYHSQGPMVQEYLYVSGKKGQFGIFRKRIFEKLAFSGADKVYFPSTGAEKMYFESGFATVSRQAVSVGEPLYNTICLDEQEKPVSGIERRSDCLTFLSVGTVTRLKGQDLSCGFLKQLVKQRDRKIRWITVGTGPILNELLEKCEDLMRKYPNFEHIHFDALPHASVLYLDSIADVYLMLHRSSIFDLATLEAMSKGCMLVLSNIGGNIDFNADNNCILVDCENMGKAVDELKKINIKEMKNKNRQVFDQCFSPECFSRRYVELIRECER